MPKITTTTALAGVAGAAAIVTLGLGASQAFAETTTPTPTPSSSSSSSSTEPAPGGRGHGHGRGGMKGADAGALAEALGLEQAQVREALQAARKATKTTERPTGGASPSKEEREARRAAYLTTLAKELGVSEDKLTAALDDLRTQHRAEHRTRLGEKLDEAVDAGTLTEADKASVLKAFDAGVLGGRSR